MSVHRSFNNVKTKAQFVGALSGMLFQRFKDCPDDGPAFETTTDVGRFVGVPHLFKVSYPLGFSNEDVVKLAESMRRKARLHKIVDPVVERWGSVATDRDWVRRVAAVRGEVH